MTLINSLYKLLTFIAPQDSTYKDIAPFTLPSGAALADPKSGTATWGTYVELITAANNTVDRLLEGVWVQTSSVEVSTLEIAQGEASSEVFRARVPIEAYTALDGIFIVFSRPLKFKKGVRIAVRASSTTNATDVKCKLAGKTGLSLS